MKIKIEFDTRNKDDCLEALGVVKQLVKSWQIIDEAAEGLTSKQAQFVRFWLSFKKEFGRSPSISEATRELGYSSNNSVYQFIRSLRKKGLWPLGLKFKEVGDE